MQFLTQLLNTVEFGQNAIEPAPVRPDVSKGEQGTGSDTWRRRPLPGANREAFRTIPFLVQGSAAPDKAPGG